MYLPEVFYTGVKIWADVHRTISDVADFHNRDGESRGYRY